MLLSARLDQSLGDGCGSVNGPVHSLKVEDAWSAKSRDQIGVVSVIEGTDCDLCRFEEDPMSIPSMLDSRDRLKDVDPIILNQNVALRVQLEFCCKQFDRLSEA